MALGGGTFLVPNKVLPGTYINFVSKSKAQADLSDRGYVAVALPLSWGESGEIITLHSEDVIKECIKLLGYPYMADEMLPIRELFKNAKVVYVYNTRSTGVKARSNDSLIDARYGGIVGNNISVEVKKTIDDDSVFEFITRIKDTIVDYQKDTLVNIKDNKFVTFGNKTELKDGIHMLSNGADGTVSNSAYEDFLRKIDPYYFNVITVATNDEKTKRLLVEYTKRQREDVGAKFQAVVHDLKDKVNYEGVVDIINKVKGEDDNGQLVYWVAGALGGCQVNKSCTNKIYDGEYTVEANYDQATLKELKLKGKFVMHMVGDDVRVLSDINTFVDFSKDKTKDFSKNQTIRVLDQLAIDTASLFNRKYLGKVPNDSAGRIELWKDIVLLHQTYQTLRAIENFNDKDIVIEKGPEKDQVIVTDNIIPVNAMEQLYMTVIVG